MSDARPISTRQTRVLGVDSRVTLTILHSPLALWRDRKRPSREVKRLAEAHIDDLERRIKEMRAVLKTLRDLAQHCHGDERSDCPILDDLAAPPSLRRAKKR